MTVRWICKTCKGHNRHADSCPHSDYQRSCKACGQLQGTPHAPRCPYVTGDAHALAKASGISLAAARNELGQGDRLHLRFDD